MEASAEIRKKLALVIGNLIRRCIHEARLIPYMLTQEEVVNLLLADPTMFEKLVIEEQQARTEESRDNLTMKVDALAELGKLDSLEVFEKPFWGESEVEISSLLSLINQLTRTFAVYLGNASTIFDKAFEDFMNKFRESLRRSGLTLKAIDFTPEDLAIFREDAADFIFRGEFLQAFTFDRLLDSQVMIEQVVRFPPQGRRLREDLIRQALNNERLVPGLVRFVLRISYISQGVWTDLFASLVRIAYGEALKCTHRLLVDLIENDVVFLCNLLQASYADLRRWPSAQRREAIEKCLEKYRSQG